jgi:hypothetical protein
MQNSHTNETTRYTNTFKGLLATIPSATSLLQQGIAFEEQMVTVWPSMGINLTKTNSIKSRYAIHQVNELARKSPLRSRGPYLIAWSRATAFGKTKAAVLVLDRSNATPTAAAVASF